MNFDMRRLPCNKRFATILLVGVLAGTVMAAAAATLPDAALFLRPAASDDGAAERDPVWRLGRTLFFDTLVSNGRGISCASCHEGNHGLSGTTPLAIGETGRKLAFRTPTLVDVGSLDRLGWTGRFADTAAVSLFAMSSPTNMGLPVESLVARLQSQPTYVAAFREAFGGLAINAETIGLALSRYVNSITTRPATFDRWVRGENDAVGQDAKRGFALFTGKARCAECHSGPAFTDGSYHDIGSATEDLGRGKTFKTSLKLQHAFKTPGLRNVAERARFMHDGSRATLEEVIDLYDRGGIDRPSRDEAIRPLHLTVAEKADLVAFLKSLSSDVTFVVRDGAAQDGVVRDATR